jgi:hypothetical protein
VAVVVLLVAPLIPAASRTQPVTVISSDVPLGRSCAPLCAAALTTPLAAIAMAIVVHLYVFIRSLLGLT